MCVKLMYNTQEYLHGQWTLLGIKNGLFLNLLLIPFRNNLNKVFTSQSKLRKCVHLCAGVCGSFILKHLLQNF